jgi:hypothetical protein
METMKIVSTLMEVNTFVFIASKCGQQKETASSCLFLMEVEWIFGCGSSVRDPFIERTRSEIHGIQF